MAFNKKYFVYFFIVLTILSITPIGFIFRNFFTYWLLTGTSAGKTIAFFLALASIFAIAHFKVRVSRILPPANALKIFVVGIALLYLLATIGLYALFSEQGYDLDPSGAANTFLLVYSQDAAINVNWLAFGHNHYLKPIVTPLLYPLRNMSFDVALPIATIVNPWLLMVGVVVLGITVLYGFAFLERFWSSNKYLALYSIVLFGLVLSTIDGSLFSSVARINITLFALLLLHEQFKKRNFAFQLWLYIFATLALYLAYEFSNLLLFRVAVAFAAVVIFAPFVASFILPMLSMPQNNRAKAALLAAIIVFAIPYLVLMVPAISDKEADSEDVTLDYYYLSFSENIDESQLAFLGEAEKITEKICRIVPTETTTIEGMFQKLEAKNLHAAILFNPQWP